MSYCIKNSSWDLKEAFSEGCAICEPPGNLGSENFDSNRVTNYLVNRKRSCEKIDNLKKHLVKLALAKK